MGQPLTSAFLWDLTRQTLLAPAGAARRLIDMGLPVRTLWMALALMTVLNAIVYSASLQIAPPAPEAGAMMPAALTSPLLFAVFLGGALVITVIALHGVGRGLDGQGSLADILVLITWLQGLRLALQVVSGVLMMAAPGLGALLVVVASVWGLYILVAFINEAHRFGSLLKAAAVLLVTAIALVAGLSLFIAVLGTAAATGGV
ncbi:Yip1 family protein [Roseovarius salinarum]|uniref:Yip1 family protein n=1 Tax=Roseovarius salinarum TaxID=1981892 RepID=UPI000C33054A|nr:Yip1 family protein [Roseovarius salinarum]